jgi:hypothetical protein
MPLPASPNPFTPVELQLSAYIAQGLWALAGALLVVLAAWSTEPYWAA